MTSSASVEAMGIARQSRGHQFLCVMYDDPPIQAETACSCAVGNLALAIDALVLRAVEAERNRSREIVAKWMIAQSFATGHGETLEDLLTELEWQVDELRALRPSNAPGAETEGR